jgi:hypothetical protein
VENAINNDNQNKGTREDAKEHKEYLNEYRMTCME